MVQRQRLSKLVLQQMAPQKDGPGVITSVDDPEAQVQGLIPKMESLLKV